METVAVAVRDYVTAQTRGGLRLVVDAPPPGPRWVIEAGDRRGPVMRATAHTPAARIACTGLVLGVLDGHEARAIGEVCDG